MHEEEEPLIFSFYQDMSKNPHVIKLMLQLNQTIHKVFSMMNKYLDGWRRYDTVYNLWNPKRKQALEKLTEKKHSCVYFDTRIASYELLAETVRAQPSEKDIDFIRIDCYPVALGIAAQADQWKMEYGAVLHLCSSTLLEEMRSRISKVGRTTQISMSSLTHYRGLNYRRPWRSHVVRCVIPTRSSFHDFPLCFYRHLLRASIMSTSAPPVTSTIVLQAYEIPK